MFHQDQDILKINTGRSSVSTVYNRDTPIRYLFSPYICGPTIATKYRQETDRFIDIDDINIDATELLDWTTTQYEKWFHRLYEQIDEFLHSSDSPLPTPQDIAFIPVCRNEYADDVYFEFDNFLMEPDNKTVGISKALNEQMSSIAVFKPGNTCMFYEYQSVEDRPELLKYMKVKYGHTEDFFGGKPYDMSVIVTFKQRRDQHIEGQPEAYTTSRVWRAYEPFYQKVNTENPWLSTLKHQPCLHNVTHHCVPEDIEDDLPNIDEENRYAMGALIPEKEADSDVNMFINDFVCPLQYEVEHDEYEVHPETPADTSTRIRMPGYVFIDTDAENISVDDVGQMAVETCWSVVTEPYRRSSRSTVKNIAGKYDHVDSAVTMNSEQIVYDYLAEYLCARIQTIEHSVYGSANMWQSITDRKRQASSFGAADAGVGACVEDQDGTKHKPPLEINKTASDAWFHPPNSVFHWTPHNIKDRDVVLAEPLREAISRQLESKNILYDQNNFSAQINCSLARNDEAKHRGADTTRILDCLLSSRITSFKDLDYDLEKYAAPEMMERYIQILFGGHESEENGTFNNKKRLNLMAATEWHKAWRLLQEASDQSQMTATDKMTNEVSPRSVYILKPHFPSIQPDAWQKTAELEVDQMYRNLIGDLVQSKHRSRNAAVCALQEMFPTAGESHLQPACGFVNGSMTYIVDRRGVSMTQRMAYLAMATSDDSTAFTIWSLLTDNLWTLDNLFKQDRDKIIDKYSINPKEAS